MDLRQIVLEAVDNAIPREYTDLALRVARVCEAAYLLDDVKFRFSGRLAKRDYLVGDNSVTISRKRWDSAPDDVRNTIIRQAVVSVIDRELHGDKAGGWQYHSLINEVNRRLGQ